MRNYYQTLSLESNCTMEEIKKAYKNHAKAFHPDKHNGDDFFRAKFVEIKEAYDVLIDAEERKIHDLFHGYISNNEEKCSTNSEQSDTAKSSVKQAKTNNSPDVDNYMDWAAKKLNNGDLFGALEEIEKAIKIDSNNGWIYWCRGDLYKQYGEIRAAKKDFERAFKLNFLEAKDDLINIEKVQSDAKELIAKYYKIAASFPLVGVIIYYIFFAINNNKFNSAAIAEGISVVGSILIARIAKNKIPEPVIRSLGFDWEVNIMLLLTVGSAMFGFPLILYFISR
ncbi:J domain-containing protein [Solitalea koreensis]|uniref:DnaJ domain-containing protein n=1 Tax=Solitalea koreensis TaxID=543615 RepID=A0A521BRI2_9SPHI|nr:DnaJ domain-containing protein [Solitalea koreensis]SMO49782.1 DnaJ domain-containing protein [Solitalea koreensis]